MIKLHIYLLSALFLTSCNWFSSPEENPIKPNNKLKLVWEIPYEHVGTSINAYPLILGDSLVIMSAGKEIFTVKQNSGKIKWKYFVSELTNVQSLDILCDGKKLYMSHVEDIRSVNLVDGSEAWVTNLPNERGNFVDQYKAINKNLYFTGDFTLYSVDTQTGSILWQNNSFTGACGSVVYYKDKLLLSNREKIEDSQGIEIGQKGFFHILNESDGTILLSKQIKGAGRLKNLAFDEVEEVIYGGTYFTDGGASFEARDANSGKIIWCYYTPNESWSYEDCTVTDDKVFVNLTFYGTAAFNKNSGNLLWRKKYFESNAYPHKKPILYKGFLYVIHNQTLFVINPETGDKIYSYMAKDNGFGTFGIANDKIFICGYNKLQCYEVYKEK